MGATFSICGFEPSRPRNTCLAVNANAFWPCFKHSTASSSRTGPFVPSACQQELAVSGLLYKACPPSWNLHRTIPGTKSLPLLLQTRASRATSERAIVYTCGSEPPRPSGQFLRVLATYPYQPGGTHTSAASAGAPHPIHVCQLSARRSPRCPNGPGSAVQWRHPEGLIDRDTFLTDVRRDLDHD